MKNLIFMLGLLFNYQAQAQSGTSNDFCANNSSAEFIGGTSAMFKFIQENLVVPKDSAWETCRAYIGFAVETDGHLTEIHIKRSLNKAFGKAALQMVQKMPKWKPAICFNTQKPVRSYYTIPVKVFVDEKR
jgi:periplasmic protein TonB